MLKAFYNAYIILQSDIKPPKVQEEKVDSLLKRYCTSVFLNFYGTINGPDELDWDPFLDAQFCSIDWLKSLTIKKDLKRNDLYYVSFIKDSSNNELTTIELSVIKEKDIYKIDSLPQLTRHIKFVRSKN